MRLKNLSLLPKLLPQFLLRFFVPAGKWGKKLEETIEEIKELATSNEGEFLKIGEKLQGYNQRAKELSKQSSAIASGMGGEKVSQTVEGLHGLYGRVQSLEKESCRNTQALRSILGLLHEVSGNLLAFGRIIRSLNVLCVYTRVESAHLGEADQGFTTLTKDVRRLMQEIEAKLMEIQTHLDTLAALIQKSLQKLKELEAVQQGKTREILEQTFSSLESLTTKQESSSQTTRNLSQSFASISGQIGEVVASMQFNDITRQQLEHVQEALAGLQEKTRGGKNGLHRRERLDMAEGVLELQVAQMNHAREELAAAVGRIKENLGGIAEQSGKMAEEVSRVAGFARETGQSFLANLEGGLSSVKGTMEEYASGRAEMAETVGSVAGSLLRISGFMKEIDKIGIAMNLIALNACIKASHIGERGESLGVLADAIHQLSVETRRQITKITEALQAINQAAESLGGIKEEENESGIEEIGGQLAEIIGSLRRVNEEMNTLLSLVDGESGRLAGDIHKTIDSIKIDEQVSSTVNRGVQRLLEILDGTRMKASGRKKGGEGDPLKSLEKSYTMNSERAVYEKVFQEKAPSGGVMKAAEITPAPAPPAPPQGEKGSEGLGDNVELF